MRIEGQTTDGRPVVVETDDVNAAVNIFMMLIKAIDEPATEPIDADGRNRAVGFQPPEAE